MCLTKIKCTEQRINIPRWILLLLEFYQIVNSCVKQWTNDGYNANFIKFLEYLIEWKNRSCMNYDNFIKILHLYSTSCLISLHILLVYGILKLKTGPLINHIANTSTSLILPFKELTGYKRSGRKGNPTPADRQAFLRHSMMESRTETHYTCKW
jgi:hypothetical protein